MNRNIIEELKWRDLVNNISNEEKVLAAQKKNKAIYCGFDPTSDSLHLGNLMQILLLKRCAIFGLQPIALIGGGTAMIGDPSGKSQERNLLSTKQLKNNVSAITKQLISIIDQQVISEDKINNWLIASKIINKKELLFLTEIKKYQIQNIAKILLKLPLPFDDLSLTNEQKEIWYQKFFLDQKIIIMKTQLINFSISQIEKYWELWKKSWTEFLKIVFCQHEQKDIKIMNNYDWLNKFDFLSWLRVVGKHFNINQMIRKETITNRLETGISFTEFSYMTLQAYDFYHLNQYENCLLQCGGSDQWGNITAGIEYIRKVTGEYSEVAGLTINLLTNSDGKKFGKSEKGAIYLSKNKTSIYHYYQFLLQQEDQDLPKLLTALTFLSKTQIDFILENHNQNPKDHIGQKTLAMLLTIFIHGLTGYTQAIKITSAFFKDQLSKLTIKEILQIFKDNQYFELHSDNSIANILVNNNICNSKREVRQLILQSGLVANGKKVSSEELIISKKSAIKEKITIIKKGKKNYYLFLHQY